MFKVPFGDLTSATIDEVREMAIVAIQKTYEIFDFSCLLPPAPELRERIIVENDLRHRRLIHVDYFEGLPVKFVAIEMKPNLWYIRGKR